MMFDFTANGIQTAKLLDKYQRLEYELVLLSGYNLELLRDMFARGYTLTPPKPTPSLTSILAELGANEESEEKTCCPDN